MDRSLTDADIRRATQGRCRTVQYSALHELGDLDQLFGSKDCVALLYQTQSASYGHWTTLVRDPVKKIIYYCDSYGAPVDDPLDDVSQAVREACHEQHAHLARLILRSGYECDYNDVPLQRLAPGVNTCGRWVVARCLMSDMSNDDWAALFSRAPDPDELVVELTDYLLPA